MSRKKNTPLPIGKLFEGDGFFHYSQQDSEQRQEEIQAIQEYREQAGLRPLEPYALAGMQAAAMKPYIVVAVVRSTGERCVQRLTDMRKFIMYDSDEVILYSPNRELFLERIAANKREQKALEQEKQKMNRSRSKKANRQKAEAAA